MSKRIQMSAEERGELVLRLLRKQATAVELAQEASISEPTLYQRKDAHAGFSSPARAVSVPEVCIASSHDCP